VQVLSPTEIDMVSLLLIQAHASTENVATLLAMIISPSPLLLPSTTISASLPPGRMRSTLTPCARFRVENALDVDPGASGSFLVPCTRPGPD
jgi:hypothetical protein